MNYEIGDIVEYAAFGGERRIVRIVAKEANIKDGQPGFDAVSPDRGDDDEETAVWGYDRQIVKVVKRRGEA